MAAMRALRRNVACGRGSNAEIILPERSISSVHAAFEIHPETKVLLLSVRATRISSVVVAPSGSLHEESVDGDCVLVFGQNYDLKIGPYLFSFLWRPGLPYILETLALEEYKKAMEREQYARSRDLPTVDDSELHTWHNTRIHTANRPLFREAPGARRRGLGRGSYGSVFAAVDSISGEAFAVKRNIIEFLQSDKWRSNNPEIWMPLRTGSLRDLVALKETLVTRDVICDIVLEQMLSALDCTAFNNICHRDVKPENILYFDSSGGHGQYSFQLADFGLAKNQQSARHYGGTEMYSAPEMHLDVQQTPKVDVWSLFVTLIEIHPETAFPPPPGFSRKDVFVAVQTAAHQHARLTPMARKDPESRASAAQMLMSYHSYSTTGYAVNLNIRPKPKPELDPNPVWQTQQQGYSQPKLSALR
ncbi:hypothetical protein SEUCBS140593_005508 [Sporothrix eucalyptigena]|uniref:Protein kinase domain-containing protein n=1 Tax=Sporothrix eucalyptigena TaxID=1812306 RepID=A0ABP0BYZ0_9PEZI